MFERMPFVPSFAAAIQLQKARTSGGRRPTSLSGAETENSPTLRKAMSVFRNNPELRSFAWQFCRAPLDHRHPAIGYSLPGFFVRRCSAPSQPLDLIGSKLKLLR